ncbi:MULTISPECIES: MurR/RpiR family transcriptional regulator [Enterococcus]|uniref:Phosphosugar isomerase transcriptional regulator n=1 Tax=Enterococcus sulfureus ATCC 49903 TaxID=1140003 RepID=S0KX49_9ENTE|nr:MurR/RpiR family transcriptional regulator [Enterococcus sulfureus]EOT49359.1 phosphosugar isomerase transcriptional regulator [Enterococcus sulfureus ATCC 49903]EOT87226.1 phosphosugar isomerase transcriptional regulator [Enterococcus sulfureus ATCC 49903]
MSDSIRLSIKSMYTNLSEKEKKIADFILENPVVVGSNSINDLSETLEIAPSTIFQFTRKIGYQGFKDFKLALLTQGRSETEITIHENIYDSDSLLTKAQKVFDTNISTLLDTRKFLDQVALEQALEYLKDAEAVYFFGVGGSEIVATDAYHKFLRAPLRVHHSTDYHIQLMEASLMKPSDCAILISHTGRSHETIEIAKAAREAGAKLIVLTSSSQSPLALLGDAVFVSIAEETEFRSEALSSRIAQLSILDSLYVILMFERKKASKESMAKVRKRIAKLKAT